MESQEGLEGRTVKCHKLETECKIENRKQTNKKIDCCDASNGRLTRDWFFLYFIRKESIVSFHHHHDDDDCLVCQIHN